VDIDVQLLHPAVRYARADGARLPFKDAVFDTVFAIDVIEHVPDERALIIEALRVLRPGGRLIMTTPNSTISVFPKVLQPWIDRQWGHDRVRGFSVGYLRGLVEGLPRAIPAPPPSAHFAGYVPSGSWGVPDPGQVDRAAAAAWDARHLEGDGARPRPGQALGRAPAALRKNRRAIDHAASRFVPGSHVLPVEPSPYPPTGQLPIR
jgi:SAM-dependent methyltransferase